MCGIAGKINRRPDAAVDPGLIRRMTDAISHRGPDGEGHYVQGPVGLGHRRLSIIDLSSAGTQPMCNEDQSIWIVFNGEIYNFQELREDLMKRGHIFKSGTDTEVIVHLYEEYGTDSVNRLRGMFAFAIWDGNSHVLFVARDRVGIKPLYYVDRSDAFSFASEIKALLVDPTIPREVNPQAIDRFLTYGFLPGTETLLKGVEKLEPGFYLLLKDGKLTRKQYWDLKYDVRHDWKSLDEAAEALSDLLRKTVKDHMISDVPVGFLASGGVDSTALLSYAIEETKKQVQTFTVGFSGAGFADERPYARLASKRFGTIHHEISMSAEDFCAFLPGYVWHMEEPVCEPPAIALYYVSKLARKHVTVLLSGEGGDEAFGGYPEYKNFPAFQKLVAAAGPFNSILAGVLGQVTKVPRFNRFAKYASLARSDLPSFFFSRTSTPASYFNAHRQSLYTDRMNGSIDGSDSTAPSRDLFAQVQGQPSLNQMLYVDTKTWLPDDLLVKADKITMANSLELRVPFLDHKVLEFAAGLPTEFKVKGRETKRVLKRAFSPRVPEEILTRKKTGFPVPFAHWLSHDLREFVADTLLSRKATERGYFERKGLEQVLARNGAGASEAFSLLVLELWHQRFIDTTFAALASSVAVSS
jgi:asparagine synthase (glutamine-hydrolysing)